MRRSFAVALVLTFVASVAHASIDPGTVTDSHAVTWQGSRFVNASTPSPEACAADEAGRAGDYPVCDTIVVHVDVDASTSPRALQVGIQWRPETGPESEGEYDTFDLYVYDPTGALVASSITPVQSSMGIASTAQVVDVADPVDGDYKAVVVPFNVADRDYHGVAFIRSLVPPRTGELLPDLHAQAPTNFKLATGTLSLSRYGTDAISCYPDELAENPGMERCLRFDAGHSNTGDGAFMLEIDLRNGLPEQADDATPTIGGPVSQLIDGSRPVPAGRYQFHSKHGHIHYRSFARYDLYRVRDGERVGDPLESRKSDFCMIDVDDLWFGLQGNGPRTRHFPQCNAYQQISAEQITQVQGIDRGWADVYTWDLPGQYIDVTGLPNGVYDVVNIVNPLHVLTEMDDSPASNEAFTRICLTATTATELSPTATTC
jgi:hypothetical protein